jgi:hypothetical protein
MYAYGNREDLRSGQTSSIFEQFDPCTKPELNLRGI